MSAYVYVRSLTALMLLCALVSCGSGGSSRSSSSLTISVQPSSSKILLGSSQTFYAAVTGTDNTTVDWSVNGIAGGSQSVGTISTSGVYTAPAILPTRATISISATSQSDPSKSATALVSVTSDTTVSAAATGTGVVLTGSAIALTAGVSSSGKPDPSVSWAVDGISGGNSSVGTITVTGSDTATYNAPAALPNPNTATITATSVADASKSASVSEKIAREFLYQQCWLK